MKFIKRNACEIATFETNMCSKDSETSLHAFITHFKRNLPHVLFIALLTLNIALQ